MALFSTREPLAWLSELSMDREWIEAGIRDLGLVVG